MHEVFCSSAQIIHHRLRSVYVVTEKFCDLAGDVLGCADCNLSVHATCLDPQDRPDSRKHHWICETCKTERELEARSAREHEADSVECAFAPTDFTHAGHDALGCLVSLAHKAHHVRDAVLASPRGVAALLVAAAAGNARRATRTLALEALWLAFAVRPGPLRKAACDAGILGISPASRHPMARGYWAAAQHPGTQLRRDAGQLMDC